MLAPEFIVFATLFAIPLIWTGLKILVNHLIDSDPPPAIGDEPEEKDNHRKAA